MDETIPKITVSAGHLSVCYAGLPLGEWQGGSRGHLTIVRDRPGAVSKIELDAEELGILIQSLNAVRRAIINP